MEVSIKVNIASRVYPLKINSTAEEGVRKAVKLINDRLKAYSQNYRGHDTQDFLSLVSLELAADLVKRQQDGSNHSNVEDILAQLESTLGIPSRTANPSQAENAQEGEINLAAKPHDDSAPQLF